MTTNKKLRRFTEPLIYVVLVAIFGFITTIVTHRLKENQIKEPDLVSLTLDHEIEALFLQEGVEVSL